MFSLCGVHRISIYSFKFIIDFYFLCEMSRFIFAASCGQENIFIGDRNGRAAGIFPFFETMSVIADFPFVPVAIFFPYFVEDGDVGSAECVELVIGACEFELIEIFMGFFYECLPSAFDRHKRLVVAEVESIRQDRTEVG